MRGKYYSFIVDRKTLSYNLSQLNYNKIKIIPISARLDEKIYKGSIIDGVLLYNGTRGIKDFVINDIYNFCGENLTNDKMKYKMINIEQYLKAQLKNDSNLNTINFIVNKFYDLRDIKKLVNNYIPKSKHSNCIKGLSFYPEVSGTKLIYLYNNCTKDVLLNDDTSDGMSISKPKLNPIIRKSNISLSDSITAHFRLKKTDTVDVYELSLSKKFKKNGKSCIKYKKCGIAFIPTRDCSYFCKDAFKNHDGDSIIVECKYVIDKDKWTPYQISNKKYPDDIDKITQIMDQ